VKTWIALAALAAVAAPAAAHHRQTPQIVQITTSGDAALPRVPAPGGPLALILPDTAGHAEVNRKDWKHSFVQLTEQGGNANVTISSNGRTLAWDADCASFGCLDPGRQIFVWQNGVVQQITHDPTGTSVNPALAAAGSWLAFESEGDLAGAGNSGGRQIFLRDKFGNLTQASRGAGLSRNAVLDQAGLNLVYDSTSDESGADTGVPQIWLINRGNPRKITNGSAPSRGPSITRDGRIVAFESRADLHGDGHDTSVSQIFVYVVATQQLSQVTTDPQGCSGVTAMRITRDNRIGFTCHGQGFFHLVTANQNYPLPISGGDTAQAIDALGTHFMLVTTTSSMLGAPGETTAGHEVYLLNLFKLFPTLP
jgi:dipeptidyl aminopeptidase/acylaminoacyl peptidase